MSRGLRRFELRRRPGHRAGRLGPRSNLIVLGFVAACGGSLELERHPVDTVPETPDTLDADGGHEVAIPDADTSRGAGLLFVGATLIGASPEVDGTIASVLVRGDKIVALGAQAEALAGEAARVDLGDRFLAPALIDSHVHLAYWDVADRLPAGGLAAVVDQAAPEDRFFDRDFAMLRVIGAGPMITAPGGYPTTSWGSDGYGRECDDAESCAAAVDALLTRGASLVKVSFGAGPDLAQAAVTAVFAEARRLGLPVSAHALQDHGARRAAELGADVLAHTPIQTLSDATIALWSKRHVITTLEAFGGTSTTVDNLRRLREAGARILYGTDLGNNRTAGIDPGELALMRDSGMTGAEILASATSVPAAFWGFGELGQIAVGKAASLLVLEVDPRVVPETLARPVAVWIDGASIGSAPGSR